jgi:hypothetical protein
MELTSGPAAIVRRLLFPTRQYCRTDSIPDCQPGSPHHNNITVFELAVFARDNRLSIYLGSVRAVGVSNVRRIWFEIYQRVKLGHFGIRDNDAVALVASDSNGLLGERFAFPVRF